MKPSIKPLNEALDKAPQRSPSKKASIKPQDLNEVPQCPSMKLRNALYKTPYEPSL